ARISDAVFNNVIDLPIRQALSLVFSEVRNFWEESLTDHGISGAVTAVTHRTVIRKMRHRLRQHLGTLGYRIFRVPRFAGYRRVSQSRSDERLPSIGLRSCAESAREHVPAAHDNPDNHNEYNQPYQPKHIERLTRRAAQTARNNRCRVNVSTNSCPYSRK